MIKGSPKFYRALADMLEYPDPYRAPIGTIIEFMICVSEEAHRLQDENERLRSILRDIHDRTAQ